MRSHLMTGAILSFSALLAAPSHAVTGNEALELCQTRQGAACSFYYHGIIDGLLAGASFTSLDITGNGDSTTALGVCAPSAVTSGQMIDVAIEYLRRNPAERHEGAGLLTIDAWREAFPCQ